MGKQLIWVSMAKKIILNDLMGAIKLTRQEMAKDEDVRDIKKTVNTLYKMLDDEARFTK